MIQDVLAFAREHISKGEAVALVTVTKTAGSSPASAGQLMAVLSDGGSMGTVGGGKTEHLLIQKAAAAIRAGEKVFSFDFDHAEEGMVCGGEMSGFCNILGNENHLYIFGGGHVGQGLAALAVSTGFFVTVIEDRREFESAFSGVNYIVCEADDYDKSVNINGSAYAVICTRGHNTDDAALRFCLRRPFGYIGMIGSRKKVDNLFDGLSKEGFTKEALEKVYAPVGLNVASSVPAEIAVSIMAEILMIKNNGTLEHKRNKRLP